MTAEAVGKVFTNDMIRNARMWEFAVKENVWHGDSWGYGTKNGNICPLMYIVFISYACLFDNADALGNVAE